MSVARVLAAVAVIAAGVAAYALYSVIAIGFAQALGGSGAQAMDELRLRPDYEKIRAAQEKLAMEDNRRKRRFKVLAVSSGVVAVAAATAATGMVLRAKRRSRR